MTPRRSPIGDGTRPRKSDRQAFPRLDATVHLKASVAEGSYEGFDADCTAYWCGGILDGTGRCAGSSEEGLVEAAVDGDGGAGDVAAARRDEERHYRGNVFRAADVAEWYLSGQLAHGLLGLGGHESKARRVDEAGTQGVDGDLGRELARQGLGEADDAGPGGDREAEARDGFDRRQRRDVDDAARTAGLHVGDGGADAAHDAHEVLIDRPAPRMVVEVGEGAERRRAVVVDQDVDAAEPGHGLVDDAKAVFRSADIPLHRDDLAPRLGREPVYRFLERGRAPRRRGDPRAFRGQGAGDRKADPLARPVGDGDPALDPEIHAIAPRRRGTSRRSGGTPSRAPRPRTRGCASRRSAAHSRGAGSRPRT